MNRIVIIGGSDAGISAGLRAREVDPASDVTILLKDAYPNFSICGLPFLIGNEVDRWQSLAHRDMEQLRTTGIRFLRHHEVVDIHPEAHCVDAVGQDGREVRISYDHLIIATGAVPSRPDIPGSDLPGVFRLRFMDDGLAISDYVDAHQVKDAVIIGTGYIGMEMADAFSRKNVSVTSIEMAPSLMPSLDPELGDLLQEMLTENGVRVLSGLKITAIKKADAHLILYSGDREIASADLILIATGARPSTDLALRAGISTGIHHAIVVNEKMETDTPHIYAAGDCVETFHRVTGSYTYMPLGTTAHKQGRIAGEHAAGGDAVFKGIVGTQSVKVFDRIVARTGLRDEEAAVLGLDPKTIDIKVSDHKTYYPGAWPLRVRLTGDRASGRLLGCQIVGRHGTEVSKRIDIIAAALYSELAVSDLVHLDLSYTPPLSSPWDPVQMAALKWLNET